MINLAKKELIDLDKQNEIMKINLKFFYYQKI